MATPSMPTMPMQSIQCDPQHLAAAVVAHISVGQPHQSQSQSQPEAQARILDRGAYASIYLVSTALPGTPKSFVVRVSTRPVYNTTARKQEKDKIRGYVGILLLIHARAPSSVRTLTPRILAYDASETCEFGHGWIAMTRLPGRPLSESWPELSPLQRDTVVRQLATFTKHLMGTSSDRGEDGETAQESWHAVGSLLVRGDCQTFSQAKPTNDRALHLDLELAPLLLPKRHGANNLRPVMPKAQPLTTPALLLDEGEDDDDDFLSCYEVMLPTPSPPSSPIRAHFFPPGSAETEIPTSAVVKSCEDWLAGIKSGMPEIVIIEVEDSSAEELQGASAHGQGDLGDVYASLALWDPPSTSNSSEETPYSTPMSTVLLLDDEDDSAVDDTFAIAFTSTPAFSPVAARMHPPPPLLTLSLPVSNLMPTGLETTKPFRRTSASSTSTDAVPVTRTHAASLPSTTLEMFHAALDAELAFLEEHQPAAARCFNNNMLRLAQCGMEDEVPRGALPAVGKWDGYSAQLKALKGIVREVVGTHDQQRDEPLVLGRLGWDAADVLVQVEEDDDGEEQVMVTGVVDWEFAGVVPQWMVSGLPGFLRDSSSSTDHDYDDDAERQVEQQEGDSVLPLWVENSTTWVLPKGIRHGDRLASVWRDTLDMDEEEDQWEKDELVRAAWKVANVEWHEVQRGCAWARGYLASCYHHQLSRSPVQNEHYLAVEVPSDGECSSGGRSRGTNDTQETVECVMPTTPTDDEVPLPTAAAPIKGGQELSFVGVFLSVGYNVENGGEEVPSDDKEESDEEGEEGEDYQSTSSSHDWRDEFESAFIFSAPSPSHSLRTSSTPLQPPTSRTTQQKHKQMAEERKQEKQNFKKGMNDPLPRAGYEVLWEVPPQPTMADLEFLVERDLDAGW